MPTLISDLLRMMAYALRRRPVEADPFRAGAMPT